MLSFGLVINEGGSPDYINVEMTPIQLVVRKFFIALSKSSNMVKPAVLIALHSSGRKFLIKDPSQDYHMQFGYLSAKELKKVKGGAELLSNTGEAFWVFPAMFLDLYMKIKRDAQIIPLKDVGAIITQAGIGKNSLVVDAGSGSGAMCCFLANIAKKVVSYDIREDFHRVVQQNKHMLGLKNLTLKLKNIYDGIDEKNVDALILDLPEPWKALDSAAKALKHGGFIVSYSPTIPQVSDFTEAARKHKEFIVLRTIELIERDWELLDRKVRPKSQQIGHSGFLTTVRRK